MAWVGDWGTFVHIPKCGGFGMRRFLSATLGQGHDDPPYHGLPETIENGFTLVRHPVSWLRSIYTYRKNSNWHIRRDERNRINHVNNWPVIMGLTQWMKGLTWGEMVDRLDYDIVSCVYGMYRHPSVKVYQLERVEDLLIDLGISETLQVTHITPGKPTVTAKQREKLERVCWRSMVDYGYAEIEESNIIAELADLRKMVSYAERLEDGIDTGRNCRDSNV